jgi:hypothetical protein
MKEDQSNHGEGLRAYAFLAQLFDRWVRKLVLVRREILANIELLRSICPIRGHPGRPQTFWNVPIRADRPGYQTHISVRRRSELLQLILLPLTGALETLVGL